MEEGGVLFHHKLRIVHLVHRECQGGMCLFFPPFFCFFGSLLCCLTGCLIAEQVEEAAQRPRSSDVVVVSVDKSSRTENSSSRNPDADLVIVNYEKRPHPKDEKLADDVVVISSSKVPMMAEAEAKAL